jgi:hypothetical protein
MINGNTSRSSSRQPAGSADVGCDRESGKMIQIPSCQVRV